MPLKKGSCLNEECTEIIEQIHSLLKEAKEKYESLPACIKDVTTGYQRGGGNTLGYLLTNGETAAWCFAKEFGIEVER